MNNFVYNIPTKIFFGRGQIQSLGSAIKEYGGSKVLIVYGGGSIKKNGIYDDVVTQLKNSNIEYKECSDIKPNPPIEDVNRGIEIYRKNNLDFILAVGGGSVIDAAKAMAAGVYYDGDVMDLMAGGKGTIQNAAPVASVLTMAGTGSEMDMGGVITFGPDHKKYTIMHPLLYPKFSILDPVYTYSVPQKHTMAGCFDALCHMMESYFIPSEATETQDRMNEGVMKVIIKNAPLLLDNPEDYNARANIMWASSQPLAGFQFALGKELSDRPLHRMGHELSSLYDMTHGITLALLTPAWMKYTIENAPEYVYMFAAFARNVFDIREQDDSKAAQQGIEKVIEFIKSIKISTTLKEAGVEKDKLEYLADKATEFGAVGTLCKIGKLEALKIFEMAYEGIY